MRRKRATVRIRGQVQGVNFRYFTRRTAEEHNLTGWVRNMPNGEVEAVFEGQEGDLRRALAWCEEGPDAARVDEVLIDWQEARGEFEIFEVRR